MLLKVSDGMVLARALRQDKYMFKITVGELYRVSMHSDISTLAYPINIWYGPNRGEIFHTSRKEFEATFELVRK